MQRFCVLTVGRAGSTSLMYYLEKFEDIGVPSKNIPCPDNELVHHQRLAEHLKQYSVLCGRPLTNQSALIEAFFDCNEHFPFAGFKTMPNRHSDLAAFTAREDIQFITLTRSDIASTAASFLVAMETGSWRRSGEPQPKKWLFKRARHEGPLLENLAYIHRSHVALSGIPRAIALTYEQLCSPDFSNPALDQFFGRKIKMENPKKPTSGRSYVKNWDEFKIFIEGSMHRIAMRGA